MAIKKHLSIDQGSDILLDIIITGYDSSRIDLETATAESKIRKHHSSANSISFTATINSASNTVSLALNHVVSQTIEPGRYVYDVELTSSNTVIKVVEGMVTVNPSATY